jgi:hypothetical protein
MQWFGKSWGAHVCEEAAHVETPVGAMCFGLCGVPIAEGDRGVVLPFVDVDRVKDAPYHLACLMSVVLSECPQCHQRRPHHKMDCSLRSADLKPWGEPALCLGCGKPYRSPDHDPRCSSCVESGTGPEPPPLVARLAQNPDGSLKMPPSHDLPLRCECGHLGTAHTATELGVFCALCECGGYSLVAEKRGL